MSPTPPSLPERGQSYDVRANDDRCHAASSFGSTMNWVAIATLLAAGIALPIIAVVRGDLPTTQRLLESAIGAAALIAGGVLVVAARSSARRRLTNVDVSLEGMALRFSDGTLRSYAWKDPALKLQIVDYSAAVGGGVAGFRSFATVPCAILVGHGPVGISLEALKGIRRAARAAGVPVVDEVPDAIGRTIRIGQSGGGSTPFSDADPYP